MLLHLQDREYWEEQFGIEQAPAIVFFRGPGSIPAVHDSRLGRRLNVTALAAAHQWPLVPQLRQAHSHQLGCGWGEGVDHAAQAQACAVLVALVPALLCPPLPRIASDYKLYIGASLEEAKQAHIEE